MLYLRCSGRSSVGLEHTHGVRGAAGSSPVAPTEKMTTFMVVVFFDGDKQRRTWYRFADILWELKR